MSLFETEKKERFSGEGGSNREANLNMGASKLRDEEKEMIEKERKIK